MDRQSCGPASLEPDNKGSRGSVAAAGQAADDWRFPWIRATLLLLILSVLLKLAWNHPTGNEVIHSSFRLLAGILSTPLLLEGAWFCMGAFVLYLYTIRRRHHEGDEWVVMEVDEPLDPTAANRAADGPNTEISGKDENPSCCG